VNTKNLHKHSLPVLGLLVAIFVLSISLANRVTAAKEQLNWRQVLVTRLVRVEPTASGLARIQLNYQMTGATASTAADSTATAELRSVGTSSGKLARLSFVVAALDPTKLIHK
jgi:hypothetical protein